jgi:hypothetical protein
VTLKISYGSSLEWPMNAERIGKCSDVRFEAAREIQREP